MIESGIEKDGQRGWRGLKPWENSKPKHGHQIRIWEIYKLFKYSSFMVSYDEYSVFQFNPFRNPSVLKSHSRRSCGWPSPPSHFPLPVPDDSPLIRSVTSEKLSSSENCLRKIVRNNLRQSGFLDIPTINSGKIYWPIWLQKKIYTCM